MLLFYANRSLSLSVVVVVVVTVGCVARVARAKVMMMEVVMEVPGSRPSRRREFPGRRAVPREVPDLDAGFGSY